MTPRCPECGSTRVELVDVDVEHEDDELDETCLDLLAHLDADEVVDALAWCWSCGHAEAQTSRVTGAA